MFVCIDADKLLEKYQTIWTKIESLKNVKLNTLPLYYIRYIKTKIRRTAIKFILVFVV